MSDERDYEKEALADGWNPDFDGPSKKDAKTFVEDGEKISGMLKGKIGRLEERIDSLTQSNADFKQYTDKQINKELAKNKELIVELEKTKAQAITDGDGIKAVQADREIQDLQVQTQPENGQLANVEGDKWFASNDWYAKNPVLHAQADGFADQLRAQGYDDQSALFFNELTSRVKDAHPKEFGNPNRQRAGTVETEGTKEVTDSKAETWANLPADAKAAAKRFEKDIPGFSKDDYVAQYEWE